MSAKNGFHEKLFRKSPFFMKISIFHENRRFLRKILKNWRFAKIGNFAKIGVFREKYL
jgi:hypothetical protein